jgi:hypothetical protein
VHSHFQNGCSRHRSNREPCTYRIHLQVSVCAYVSVCAEMRITRVNANTANTQPICKKRLVCILPSTTRQYSQLLSLRACLYIQLNRLAYLLGLRALIRKDAKRPRLLGLQLPSLGIPACAQDPPPPPLLLLGLLSLGMPSTRAEEEEAAAAVVEVLAPRSNCVVCCSSSPN